ncbi:MAG TPA: helix-turn-helix domain-containing protein [Terriglobales bacterium]|nr:helix-turn-helix domain-containing protein [Terriglobales bacterium]
MFIGLGDRILDVQQLAAFFDCSTEKIKRMLRSHQLPGFKFGKNWFVRVEDLERHLASAVESNSHLRRSQ